MTQSPSPKQAFDLRLNNMALAVADLTMMVRWYRQVLGLRLAEQGRFDVVGADYAMLDGNGFHLELVSRTDATHHPVDRAEPPFHLDRLGWKALVLETDDLEAVGRQLAAEGVEILWQEAPLTADRRSTMIRDPEGNMIHIFGPRDRS